MQIIKDIFCNSLLYYGMFSDMVTLKKEEKLPPDGIIAHIQYRIQYQVPYPPKYFY